MTRRERDFLGEREVRRVGAATASTPRRALENFPLLGRPVHPALARAFGAVKLAAVRTNRALGYLSRTRQADALERACRELFDGAPRRGHRRRRAAGRRGHQHQHERERGAGEPGARAARAVARRLRPPCRRSATPTCTRARTTRFRPRCAWPRSGACGRSKPAVVALQEAFQAKERAFAARGEGRPHRDAGRRADDARPGDGRVRGGAEPRPVAPEQVRGAPAGRQPRRHGHRHRAGGAARLHLPAWWTSCARSPAWAWRAPRTWSRRRRTRTCSSRCRGCSRRSPPRSSRSRGDLRLLSSGPERGPRARFGCRRRQAGSSIMPGKVNPVIPEAVTQAALLAIGHDQAMTMAAAMGSLELNPFLPLRGARLLESFDLLARGVRHPARALRRRHRGRRGAVPAAGGERDGQRDGAACPRSATSARPRWSSEAPRTGRGFKDVAVGSGVVTAEQFDAADQRRRRSADWVSWKRRQQPVGSRQQAV